MNVDRIIDAELQEDDKLEYKHPEENSADFAKELAAFANSGGGTIIVGVAEADGDISDLVSVGSLQQLEERVHQAISTRLDPTLQVNIAEHTYQGAIEAWHDTTLASLTRAEAARLHTFKRNDDYLVPVRQGSTTRYANGQEIADFYESGVHPGRVDDIETDPHADTTNWVSELGDVVAELAANSGSPEETASAGADDEETVPKTPSFEQTDPPYYFTPTGAYDTITFHFMMAPYQPHAFESVSQQVTRTDVADVLAALHQYFDLEIDRGRFTISQRNGAWFGTGAGNFLRALDQRERYQTVPTEYDLNRHHSEGTIFIADLNHPQGGQVVLRARDGVGSDVVEEFSVNFLTEGIPVDTRQLTQFLTEIDFSLHNGQSVDLQTEALHLTSEEIELTPIDRVESRHKEGWVGAIVCANPFHDDPGLLRDQIDAESWEYFEPLTTYEQLYFRLSDHHPMTEQRDYYFRQGHLQSLTPVQGSISHLNASLSATW